MVNQRCILRYWLLYQHRNIYKFVLYQKYISSNNNRILSSLWLVTKRVRKLTITVYNNVPVVSLVITIASFVKETFRLTLDSCVTCVSQMTKYNDLLSYSLLYFITGYNRYISAKPPWGIIWLNFHLKCPWKQWCLT